jgi:serine/threonine protein kinase
LAPELHPALEEIILHALERNPADRYQSAGVMKRELDNLDLVVLTHRDQRLRAPQPWKSRSRLWILIVGIVLAQVAIFFALFLLLRRHH